MNKDIRKIKTYLEIIDFLLESNKREFYPKVTDIVEQLNSEKKAMYKIWASREKQIWVVQENISALFGSIKGIAGKKLDTANVLQLTDRQVDD